MTARVFIQGGGEPYGAFIMKRIQKNLEKMVDSIMAQREKILIGFIAETGCKPSEAEQVLVPMPDGGISWFVRKKEQ